MKEQNFLKKIRKYLWILLGLIITFALLYSDIFFGKYKLSFTNIIYEFQPFNMLDVAIKGPLLSDVTDQNYTVFFNYIHDFFFTFWNPQIGMGAPQSMWFYLFPLHYLYLLPLDIGIFLVSISKFLIAFIGMYLFIKEYNGNKKSAFIAGLTYTFSSILVYWHGWPHTSVAMLAPFMFLFTEKFFKTSKVKYLFLLSIVTYLSLVAGMPTYTAYFLYLLGIYVFVYGIKYFWNDKKKLMLVFIGFGCSVLLAAVASLPYTGDLLTSVGSNGYSDSRKYQSATSLNFDFIRTMIFPTIRNGAMQLHANESTLYTGILAIVLFPFSLMNRKNKSKVNFWFCSSIILLLLIFTGVFNVIFTHLPMINTSLKTRVIVLLNFTLAVLVGINFNDIYVHTSYYLSRKIKVIAALLFSFGVFIIAGKSLGPFSGLSEKYLAEYHQIYAIVLFSILLVLLIVFVKSTKARKLGAILLCLITILDMTSFAKAYLPLIDQSAEIVPEATDTIKYLEKNTQENEKTVFLGTWTFFPSINVYYGIRDIRAHDFVLTNKDIVNYYTRINEDAFNSPTRVSFQKIENENLLKYMGVKYISSGQISDIAEEYSGFEFLPTNTVYNGYTIEQSFTSKVKNLNHLSVLMGNYDNVYADETITFEILDAKSNEVIHKVVEPAKNIKNNSFFTVEFPEINNSESKNYILRINSDVPKEKPFALFTTVGKVYGKLTDSNDADIEGNLVLVQGNGNDSVHIGEDGLYSKKLDEYSDQVEVVENLVIKENYDQVLDSMAQKYNKNTIYLTKKDADSVKVKDIEFGDLDDVEKMEVNRNEKNGTMILETNFKKDRLVLINEYNDGDWKAYVNGKEEEVVKGNYLFRAVKVPAGKQNVEVKYVPHYKLLFIKVSYAAFAVFFILLFTSIYLEKRRKRTNEIKKV
ncbi:YfhO family protein [Erwinia sp. CPCC 100877]|nr:YfhO family protein [Erwinia sp. CPCC 100877]